jgi:hypothetical protein
MIGSRQRARLRGVSIVATGCAKGQLGEHDILVRRVASLAKARVEAIVVEEGRVESGSSEEALCRFADA